MKLNLERKLARYTNYLFEQERSDNTLSKYQRDIQKFIEFSYGENLTKELVINFKKELISKYAPKSVNSILAAVNGFLQWLGLVQLKVKPIKIQKEVYARAEKELSFNEYKKLVQAAEKNGDIKMSLIMQTICCSGIRVSELEFITVESIKNRRAYVNCKGKTRMVILQKELCLCLKEYCKKQKINIGSIFLNTKGKPVDRFYVWKKMKSLCKQAGILSTKVFPHNLRHLFARTFYKTHKDLSRLADLLGHSSVDTTKIYTVESSVIHERQLKKMSLFLGKKMTT